MFVRDFIDVVGPFEAIAPRLVRDADWLDPIASCAVHEAISTLGALRPEEPIDLARSPIAVRCARGPVRLRADSLVMSLRWETNPPSEVLPRLDGELEVAPLGHNRSQLALNASAAPSSRQRDCITRRVIETGLRAFLRQLAAALEGPRTGRGAGGQASPTGAAAAFGPSAGIG